MNGEKMIFRDDDIHFLTDMKRFKRVDSLFMEYGIEHHIAILCSRFEEHKELIDYIHKHKHIIPQIHGWEHIDYTHHHDKVKEHLKLCFDKFKELKFPKPTIWFPPWNMTDDINNFLADEFGLKVMNVKTTLTDFIQQKNLMGDVVNFHYWADLDTHMIDPALRIEYNNRHKEQLNDYLATSKVYD
jgi:hypothetical protein